MDAKQFIASLPQFDATACLGDFGKKQLLDAQVTLPVPVGFTGRLAAVAVRRPYHAQSELIVVDVSRLPAP